MDLENVDFIFSKTSTFNVNYHKKRDMSSHYPKIFRQDSTLRVKDLRSKSRVIRNDEDLNNPDP
jgi:hypothetical protein